MSTFQHTRNSVTAAVNKVQNGGPSIHLEQVTPINSKFARVVGTIVATASADQVYSAVRKLTDGKFIPVEGAFQAIASNPITKSVEGVVAIKDERIVLDDNNRSAFKAVASNMYMDTEDHLWSLRKTEAGDILIKAHAADEAEVMNQLMACVASSSSVGQMEAIPASANLSQKRAEVQGGDLVKYVNKEGNCDMAFVVASVDNGSEDLGVAIVNRSNETEMVDRNLIVDVVPATQIEFDETAELQAVAAGNYSVEMIADYYRKMFMRRPEYFEAFWQRFKNHGVL